ncbi:pescadillo-like protein [Tanacetum coccineum]
MGFLYGELKKAKEDIKMAFNNVETYYRPIIDDIETRSKGRLDSPLHLIAYLLNPYYFFKDQSIKDDVMVSNAVYAFLEKFFHHDFEKQDQVMNIELPKYKGKEGDFGRMLAAKGCSENNSSYDPGTWWMNYGNKTPILQKMAIKILLLTTSSFGCERNWNAFEGFNAKLINKWARVKNKNIDILHSFDASKAQSWIFAISDDEEIEEDGSLVVGGEVVAVDRELHEDDFVSDEEQVEGGENFEFNSDEEDFI